MKKTKKNVCTQCISSYIRLYINIHIYKWYINVQNKEYKTKETNIYCIGRTIET